jgi:hypothetical protein
MGVSSDIPPRPDNLKATAILDIGSEEVRSLTDALSKAGESGRHFLQKAHRRISETIRPVYSVNEWQPVSMTLRKMQGSCSQRMACLEAVARADGFGTRVRALQVRGRFWYPRFWFSRPFIPRCILLVWPQFFVDGTWVDFDELYAPMDELAAVSEGFKNDGETLFEAVEKMPVDFLGKTCGLSCARPGHDLSVFIREDLGFFDTRDEAFKRVGTFQKTIRGRVFEIVFGGRQAT